MVPVTVTEPCADQNAPPLPDEALLPDICAPERLTPPPDRIAPPSPPVAVLSVSAPVPDTPTEPEPV